MFDAGCTDASTLTFAPSPSWYNASLTHSINTSINTVNYYHSLFIDNAKYCMLF